ncbi:phaC PHA synthase [Agarivorans sp. TSD2052]|uniref:VC2662 family protein n=1 Tax=Agarivorans sp. TSD2052 TaxID=2937286 RepID=UPI00200CF49D|nr:phaC PHA synthase [Agarivorans sp. TSD2052]UPW17528.1 phaC PHA synthase [Agarivorans sp. TSD2052]
MKKIIAAIALSTLVSAPVLASSPVMFSTINGYNAPKSDAVEGVRLSVLHGQVDEVKGVDFSVLGMSETKRTTGINFGLFFGGAKVTEEMKGASLGLFNWNTGTTTGINLAAVNITNDVNGLNWSAVNYSEGYTKADLGFASISDKSNFQLGVFNMTKEIDGVQIGLINCADNGFFKCFPIFNFAK